MRSKGRQLGGRGEVVAHADGTLIRQAPLEDPSFARRTGHGTASFVVEIEYSLN